MSDPNPFAERVLDLVERIPPGRVMAYGDVAEALQEGGPRQVGRVMALYGGGVPWWRVVRADGSLPPSHAVRAPGHYRAEGTPLRSGGERVDIGRARWVPAPDEVPAELPADREDPPIS
ncbi:MGMT family protein [Embleya sp. NPDC001921]